MAPIQSRRSRKLRETAYVNGQHSNVLKEISNPGKDGTIPLLNFLENTERFIADTNILYSRVNDLEQEQERLKQTNKKTNILVEYLKQMTEMLNELLPEEVPRLDVTLLLQNIEDTTDDVHSIEKEPTNYFKPNESKRKKHPFPHFSNEHVIKISIGTDIALMDVDTPEIQMLQHAHGKKSTMDMSIDNGVRDEDDDEAIMPEINTLGYHGTRKNGLELPVTNRNQRGDVMIDEHDPTALLKQTRGKRRKQRLYGNQEFQDIDEQLHHDSDKVEHLLGKLKRTAQSRMSLVNRGDEEMYVDTMRYELEGEYDDVYLSDARFTAANVREELLSTRRIRRNNQGLALTQPYITKQEVVKLQVPETPISKPRRRGTQRMLDPTIEKEMLIIHEADTSRIENTLHRLKPKQRHSQPPLATTYAPHSSIEVNLKIKSQPLSLLGRSKARSMKLREMQKQNEEMNAILYEEMRELDAIRVMLLEEDD
jgi:hypothetical protein